MQLRFKNFMQFKNVLLYASQNLTFRNCKSKSFLCNSQSFWASIYATSRMQRKTRTSATISFCNSNYRTQTQFLQPNIFLCNSNIVTQHYLYATKITKTIFKKQKLLLNSNFTVFSMNSDTRLFAHSLSLPF